MLHLQLCDMKVNTCGQMCARYMLVCSGSSELQCQTEVAGASSVEDLTGSNQIQQPEEGNGVGRTLPHAGPRPVEPRVFVQSFVCY